MRTAAAATGVAIRPHCGRARYRSATEGVTPGHPTLVTEAARCPGPSAPAAAEAAARLPAPRARREVPSRTRCAPAPASPPSARAGAEARHGPTSPPSPLCAR
jgi:hypothetical protein